MYHLSCIIGKEIKNLLPFELYTDKTLTHIALIYEASPCINLEVLIFKLIMDFFIDLTEVKDLYQNRGELSFSLTTQRHKQHKTYNSFPIIN